jgi:hypothetical protein
MCKFQEWWRDAGHDDGPRTTTEQARIDAFLAACEEVGQIMADCEPEPSDDDE